MNPVLMLISVILPIIAGLLIPAFHFKEESKQREIYIEAVVIITSIIVWMLLLNRPAESFTFASFTRDLTLTLNIDGMSMIFSGLISFLWPLATLYAYEYMTKEEHRNIFFTFYTATYGVTLGISFSGNLLTMYFFYELLTLVTVPLVMHTLTRKAILASRSYLYYSLGGAAFAFIGMIFVIQYGNTLTFTYGGVLDTAKIAGKENILQLIYVMAFMGFGVKAAICPFNAWLPQASVAPTPVTALLHAVAVVKAGAFAVLRLTYFCFGTDLLRGGWAQATVMGITMFTIVYGCSKAVKDTHFKRRLAYSTISNLSYILFGAALMTPLGLIGGLCHMVIHAIMKICSFFCAGAVLHQTEREYVHELDGLGRKMPKTFVIFTLSALSLMGVPGFAGFISKWNLAKAAVESGNIEAYVGIAALLVSALLTAIYMLTVVVRAFFPKEGFDYATLDGCKDPNWKMMLPLYIFVVLIMVIGLHSQPLVDFITKVGMGLI